MDIIQAIKVKLVAQRPYYATAIFALRCVPRPGLGTMAVDKYGRIYYDPDKIGTGKAWSIDESVGALMHELNHWLRKHHERAEPLVKAAECPHCEHRLVNIAEDMAINCDLKEEGVKLPGDCYYPSTYKLPDHKMWEWYYEELKKLRDKQPKHDGDGEAGHYHIVPPGTPGAKPVCGSAAHGVSQPYEEPAPGQTGKDGTTGQGLSDAESDMIRDGVAREVIRQASQSRGTIPAGLLRWANERLAPAQVPWERELAALVRNAVTMAAGCVDYVYTRPARRGNFNGIIMPKLMRPNPEAAVVLDTSGSMGDIEISTALAEINGVLRAVGQRNVPVICCDAAAAQAQRVSRAESIQVLGGGGTDMCVGIEAAQKLHCGVIIVLTDGFTPWPAEPIKGNELVIGIVGASESIEAGRRGVPAWAKRVLSIPLQSAGAA